MSTSDRPLPKTNAVSERRVARSSLSESRRYARPPARLRAHAADTVARCRGRQWRYAPAASRVRSTFNRSSTSADVRADAVALEVLLDPRSGRGEPFLQ